MGNLLTSLMLVISVGVFNAVSGIYSLFYGLATARLFNNATIQSVSNNVYVLVSVVILFAFSVKLIEAIVNPDLLTDAKKGVTGVLKRTIIGLLLIVAVPAIFNFVYYLQAEIIVGGLVEKIVLGYVDSDSEAGIEGAGGELTSTLITSFIIPVDENGVAYSEYGLCGGVDSCNYADKLLDANPEYEPYVSFLGGNPQYDRLTKIKPDKEWENGEPIYQINGLALVIVGCFVLYQIIILCMDAGLRLVKLGMLEVIAPIVIVSYIASGADHLSKWAKMTVQEFTSILIRIAGLCFMVLGFRLMNAPDSIFNNDSVSFWFKVFLIIGLLRMIKEMPDMFGKLFGANIKMGSIKDKLGEMAGIGKMAQNAWSGLGGLGKATAGGIAAALVQGDKALSRRVANTKFGRKMGISDRTIAESFADSKAGRIARVGAAAFKGGSKDGVKNAKAKAQELFAPESRKIANREKDVVAKGKNKALVAAAKMHLKINGDDPTKLDFAGTAASAKTTKNIKDMSDNLIKEYGPKAYRGDLQSFSKKNYEAKNAKMNADAKKGVTDTIDGVMNALNNTQKAEAKDLIRDINAGKLSKEEIKDKFLNLANSAGSNGLTLNQLQGAASELEKRSEIADSLGSLTASKTELEQKQRDAEKKLSDAEEEIKKISSEDLKSNPHLKEIFDDSVSTIRKSFNAVDDYQRESIDKYAYGTSNNYYAGDISFTGQAAPQPAPAPTQQEAPTGRPGGSTVASEVTPGTAGTSTESTASPAPAPAQQEAPAGRPGGSTTAEQQAAFNQQNNNTTIINNNTAPAAESTTTSQSTATSEQSGSVGRTVKAEFDTSGLETKLGELGKTFTQGSKDIVDQVRTSGDDIKTNVNNVTEALNNINSNMQGTNNVLGDIKKAAKDTNEKLDENNSKKDDE